MANDVIASLAAQVRDLGADVLSELENAVRTTAPSSNEIIINEAYARVRQIRATTEAEIGKIIEKCRAEHELSVKQGNETKIQELAERLSAEQPAA